MAGVDEIDLTPNCSENAWSGRCSSPQRAHTGSRITQVSWQPRAQPGQNTLMVASMYSTVPSKAIAEVAGQRWFNGYLLRDRGLAQALIERAQAAGYQAVSLTVDQPMAGRRERDIRNDFHLPAGIGPANFTDLERAEVAPIEQITAMQDPSLTWADLASFCRAVSAARDRQGRPPPRRCSAGHRGGSRSDLRVNPERPRSSTLPSPRSTRCPQL